MMSDALLADLQNHSKYRAQENAVTGEHRDADEQRHEPAQQSSVPGYGSLRSKTAPVIASSPSPTYTTVADLEAALHEPKPSVHSPTPLPTSSNALNLADLDSLLDDLSNSRYATIGSPSASRGSNGSASPRQAAAPTVDSLLDELIGNGVGNGLHTTKTVPSSPEPIYAVVNGSSKDSPKTGKQITITVRETKTERLTPINGHQQPQQMHQRYNGIESNGHNGVSSATKELDDLMASLSDFKVNTSSHQHQTVTEYAPPTSGISFSHSETHSTHITQRDQLDSMLGNLEADMSRQGVSTPQKGACTACDKPIVGQVITALGKTWHPEHFTCNHCAQELGTRNFFERDGQPYCEPDYHNLFSPRCAYCNGAILDKCVTTLEKTWHTEHFFCAQCGQQFGEDGFHERDGKPYCRNDYFDMFAPKCNGCNRAIMENYISALNSQWHPDCFVCRDCKKPVRGKSFYAMEGKPVCPTCAGVEEE